MTAVVVHADARLEPVNLMGDDAERFAEIRLLIGARSLDSIAIDDHDGPAAVAWVDEFADRKGLDHNAIVSTLADRSVVGPAVITGFGYGEQASLTSVHAGLRRVLERMVADTPPDRAQAPADDRSPRAVDQVRVGTGVAGPTTAVTGA